jgi:hypothetical protein
MMKKAILVMICFFLALNIQAQDDNYLYYTVNWNNIKKQVQKNPGRIKKLVDKLLTHEFDSTIVVDDYILAYYGNSYLTKGKEKALVDEMQDSLKVNNSLGAMKVADKVLAINKLNIDALVAKMTVLRLLNMDSKESNAEVKKYVALVSRIFNVIGSTGDGSRKFPYAVTSTADEYCFLKYYLEAGPITKQSMDENCDVMQLPSTTAYYNRLYIYFDHTRIAELEGNTSTIGNKK